MACGRRTTVRLSAHFCYHSDLYCTESSFRLLPAWLQSSQKTDVAGVQLWVAENPGIGGGCLYSAGARLHRTSFTEMPCRARPKAERGPAAAVLVVSVVFRFTSVLADAMGRFLVLVN